ncbi:glycosyltransferase [Rhizorhabdus argentea]|uniref:glycosyltransferase n=1 Tax=Rhizorhabdus argentea TaxID=1387174 RepID=UPI003BF53256
MITALAGAATLVVWLYLLVAHGRFWWAAECDDGLAPPPAAWPDVAVIVPARDEADVIAESIGSLAAQDYPGRLRIILVDDGSGDGTGRIARDMADRLGSDRLTVIEATSPPRGWTGKLWALAQGSERAGAQADYLWFTDADIVHAPDTARSLVARSLADDLVLNSLMADLRCTSFAERALIPAFIFFFQMLYPFARVNRPTSPVAGAAGGCVLLRRDAFERAGGVAAIADAIIDDCALGLLMKRQGPIRLSLTRRSRSIRPYGGWRPIGAMIARSAYAQLRYSPLLLAGTLAGMALVYIAPPLLAIFASGAARIAGLSAWAMMAIAFQPTLRFYRRSPLWGLALPAIAIFYVGATFRSALDHWQGRGGMWKGRLQAQLRP